MIANSYFDGIIKTIGIIGQAGGKIAEGLKNRKPKKEKGRGFIYVWAATTELHSLNIYRALPEAWLCVKGWLRSRLNFGKAKNAGERTACTWVTCPRVWQLMLQKWQQMLREEREKTNPSTRISRGHQTKLQLVKPMIFLRTESNIKLSAFSYLSHLLHNAESSSRPYVCISISFHGLQGMQTKPSTAPESS